MRGPYSNADNADRGCRWPAYRRSPPGRSWPGRSAWWHRPTGLHPPLAWRYSNLGATPLAARGGAAPAVRVVNPFANPPAGEARWFAHIRVLAEAEAASGDRDAQIEAARRAWYEGFVAEGIDAFVASAEIMDVTGRPNRSLLTGSDLAGWHASVEEPARFGFRGLTVCKT